MVTIFYSESNHALKEIHGKRPTFSKIRKSTGNFDVKNEKMFYQQINIQNPIAIEKKLIK